MFSHSMAIKVQFSSNDSTSCQSNCNYLPRMTTYLLLICFKLPRFGGCRVELSPRHLTDSIGRAVPPRDVTDRKNTKPFNNSTTKLSPMFRSLKISVRGKPNEDKINGSSILYFRIVHGIIWLTNGMNRLANGTFIIFSSVFGY